MIQESGNVVDENSTSGENLKFRDVLSAFALSFRLMVRWITKHQSQFAAVFSMGGALADTVRRRIRRRKPSGGRSSDLQFN